MTIIQLCTWHVAICGVIDWSFISVGCRPESNNNIMLKNLSKMLPEISPKFHLLCFSVFLLCLHYATKLPTILSIFHGKCEVMTVLLKHFTIREYQFH